ncbi:DUF6318 family protein [Cellulomonas persica]|uniref:DUF6318 domain-containing protein n=1 Tax=Cellulomonas persica TaxID=76861 RepID=A0A510USN4_9CELL|nr:DUF6318 family protein [Cellulomonas persica]GEK16471.1 hypothetical protein CPE01_02040 [Cellulomonas persica]
MARAVAFATAIGIGISLGLAACTGSGGADPTAATTAATSRQPPTPSPSPTPVPSPAPTGALPDVTVAPTAPAALDGPPTEANAAAVAEYFMSLFPYMYATGDTSEWERLSGKNCGYCAGTLADLREKVAAGRHAVGGNFEFEASGSSTFDGDEYFAWVVFIQHPSRALDESGELVEGFPETSRVRAQVSLIWDGAGWTVDGVDPRKLGTL